MVRWYVTGGGMGCMLMQCALPKIILHVPRYCVHGEKQQQLPLHPISVDRPFQIVGVDIHVMDLPKNINWNCHVLVFQDYLTKWTLVYPIPDQKTIRIVHILVKELIPFFGSQKSYCQIEAPISCHI